MSSRVEGKKKWGRATGRELARKIASKYAIVLILALLIILFSLLRPGTFFTVTSAQSILANQAVLVVLALGLTVALSAGEFDLSVASVVVTGHVVSGSQGLPVVSMVSASSVPRSCLTVVAM